MKKTTVTGIGYSGISVEHIDHDLEYTNYVREAPTYMQPPGPTPRSKRKEELTDEFEEPLVKATREQNVRRTCVNETLNQTNEHNYELNYELNNN